MDKNEANFDASNAELEEFSEEKIELIRTMAELALESGLVPRREDLASDYIDSLLPA